MYAEQDIRLPDRVPQKAAREWIHTIIKNEKETPEGTTLDPMEAQ
jgi:hypothetical protein